MASATKAPTLTPTRCTERGWSVRRPSSVPRRVPRRSASYGARSSSPFHLRQSYSTTSRPPAARSVAAIRAVFASGPPAPGSTTTRSRGAGADPGGSSGGGASVGGASGGARE
eukprot:scaffold114983_cov75-Phaeocystis_antarctica.AAC.3